MERYGSFWLYLQAAMPPPTPPPGTEAWGLPMPPVFPPHLLRGAVAMSDHGQHAAQLLCRVLGSLGHTTSVKYVQSRIAQAWNAEGVEPRRVVKACSVCRINLSCSVHTFPTMSCSSLFTHQVILLVPLALVPLLDAQVIV